VRNTWWDNLSQITNNNLIPSRKCLYKFENPEDCPWGNRGSGIYIFELHLLQVLSSKEAWSFKRYVDNHSKRSGVGQTFTLCSSKHKEEWNILNLKSNKCFKKARMINVKAFTDKQMGFLFNSKYRKIWDTVKGHFEEYVHEISNCADNMEDSDSEE